MYNIMVKTKTNKKYYPLGKTGPLINTIHAHLFFTKEEATSYLEELKFLNPHIQFKLKRRT